MATDLPEQRLARLTANVFALRVHTRRNFQDGRKAIQFDLRQGFLTALEVGEHIVPFGKNKTTNRRRFENVWSRNGLSIGEPNQVARDGDILTYAIGRRGFERPMLIPEIDHSRAERKSASVFSYTAFRARQLTLDADQCARVLDVVSANSYALISSCSLTIATAVPGAPAK